MVLTRLDISGVDVAILATVEDDVVSGEVDVIRTLVVERVDVIVESVSSVVAARLVSPAEDTVPVDNFAVVSVPPVVTVVSGTLVGLTVVDCGDSVVDFGVVEISDDVPTVTVDESVAVVAVVDGVDEETVAVVCTVVVEETAVEVDPNVEDGFKVTVVVANVEAVDVDVATVLVERKVDEDGDDDVESDVDVVVLVEVELTVVG